jgi:hypothetical protein
MSGTAPKAFERHADQARISWRAVLIGLFLLLPNAFWIVYMETIFYIAHSTNFGLVFHAVVNLALLLVLNIVLRRISPRLALKQGELLTIYIMLCVAGTIAGHAQMQILPPTLAAPFGFATAENDWRNLFGHHYPDWLVLKDPDALAGYVATATRQATTLYATAHVIPWLVPIAVWTGFIFVFMFVMLCINVVLRKQWTDRERLTYPLIQLPFEMADPQSGLLRNRLFWTAAAIVGAIDVLNGLHTFYPAVPTFHMRAYDLGQQFTGRPWEAIGYMAVIVRPFAIGMLFLIPLDMLFSSWFFFFFLWKAQLVVGDLWGLRERPEFPEQSAGAYIGLCIIALWTGRRHFARVVRSVWDRSLSGESGGEPLPYNVAFLGMIGGFIAIVLFCWQAGMTMWGAALFFGLMLMTNIAVTRIRAEVGSPMHDLHFAGPEVLMVDAFGRRGVGERTLSIISLFWFISRAHYTDPMPHQLEGIRIADRARMNQRRLFVAVMAAALVGTLAAFWALLDGHYRYGAGWGGEPMTRLYRWLSSETPPDPEGLAYFAAGLGVSLAIMFMRVKFTWWTLHPAGYAISSSYGMRDWWLMFLVVWFIKWILLKKGGLKAYRTALPFFLGLILGEFVVGSFWAILGVFLKQKTFGFTAWW